MKIIFTLLLFLVTTVGATVWNTNGSYADVQSKVNGAARGDTVQIPSGSPNWGNNTLTITKGLFLQGSGRDSLTVTGSPSVLGGMISIAPDATAIANDEVIRVEGITFDGSLVPGDNSSRVITVIGAGAGGTKAFKNLAIGNCRFSKVANQTTCIYSQGQVRGCIYNNIFDRCNIIIRPLGNDSTVEWSSGNFPFAYGNSDNLFFEGNLIEWSVTGDSFAQPGWTENGQSGRIVIRYNTWNFLNAKDYLGHDTNLEIFDIHGFQNWPGNGQTGSMIEEIYGNTILNYKGGPSVIHRGSWAIVHDNAISGSGSAQIQAREYGRGAVGGSGCSSEVPGATGVYIAEINNTYCFNNTLNGSQQDMINGGLGDACGCAENLSWWNYNSAFSGSVGIGRGTTAPAMSATNGTAYWKNATATPSTDPNVVQAGHLYKRVSGAWVDYYHPYTYPHPLSSGDPAVTTSPVITNLSSASGYVGTSVVITGSNFGASQGGSTVKFNGTTATASAWSATSITVAVPSATTGNVVVTVSSVASNAKPFTVTAPIALPTWNANVRTPVAPFYVAGDNSITQDSTTTDPTLGGSIDFDVNVTSAGFYEMSGSVKGEDGGSNSMFAFIDQQPAAEDQFTWATFTTGFQTRWVRISPYADDSARRNWFLTVGVHHVIIRGREAGTKLASISLTPQPTPSPAPTPSATPTPSVTPTPSPGATPKPGPPPKKRKKTVISRRQ